MSNEKPKLGEILVKSGAISLRDLETFLQQQEELKDERGYQTKLGSLLLEHKLANEETLALAFSIQQGVEYHDLQMFSPDLNLLEKIPFSILSRFKFVPIYMDNRRLVIAIHDPIDTFLFDLLYKALGLLIEFRSATRSGVDVCHSACLKSVQDSGRMNKDFDVDFDEYRLILQAENISESTSEKRAEVTLEHTLNNLGLEALLHYAFRENQSDSIQIRMQSGKVNLRIRVGKEWKYFGTCSHDHFAALYSRAKSYSDYRDMEISYVTQCFIEIPLGEDEILQFNALFIPEPGHKELLLELYGVDSRNHSLNRLGILPSDIQRIQSMNFNDRGALILGASGMGKTIFLNALLQEKMLKNNHYLYFSTRPTAKLENISLITLDAERRQLQSIGAASMSCFNGVVLDGIEPQQLTSCIRLVGDQTLFASMDSAPVFPALSSLEKQGESLGFILDKFHFIIYIKLVPGLCPYCTQPHRVTDEELTNAGLKPEIFRKPNFYYAVGCDYCENKGYTDFVLIYEFLDLESQVQKIIQENPVGNDMAMHLLKSGSLIPVRNSARDKLYRGKISLETYMLVIQKKI